MADARIGYGAELWLAGADGTLVEVAEVTEINLPNPQQDDVEATHFKSPGRAKEYIPGLIDNGEITFGINYIAGSDTDALINDALSDDAARDMKVVIPSGEGSQDFTFPGIVKGYEKAIPIGDRQTATITVRVAGAVTQAPTAP